MSALTPVSADVSYFLTYCIGPINQTSILLLCVSGWGRLEIGHVVSAWSCDSDGDAVLNCGNLN